MLPAVGFHHVHMNVVDPERSISFYTRSFQQTRRTAVAGWDAVQSEESYLLSHRGATPRISRARHGVMATLGGIAPTSSATTNDWLHKARCFSVCLRRLDT